MATSAENRWDRWIHGSAPAPEPQPGHASEPRGPGALVVRAAGQPAGRVENSIAFPAFGIAELVGRAVASSRSSPEGR